MPIVLLIFLSLFCKFGLAVQSYNLHPPKDDLTISYSQVRLDAKEQEFMPSASLYYPSEDYIAPGRLHRFSIAKGTTKPMTDVDLQTKLPPSFNISGELEAKPNSNQENEIDEGNSIYRRTPPIIKYKFGVVADLDHKSHGSIALGDDDPRASKTWVSYLKQGFLSIQQSPDDPELYNVTMEWESSLPRKMVSGLNYAGRGMELSTFNVFNGKVLACDDKTAVVYELQGIEDERKEIVPIPFAILGDKDSSTSLKGYQCEWATVKDGDLWIGSHGISELNDTGEAISMPKKLVKRVTPEGIVTTLDWSKNYDKMSNALYVPITGYVRHETGLWSDILQKWIFMPRRVSKEKFNPYGFARSGSNVVLFADEDFKNTQVHQIGDLISTHGFTAAKFVPGTDDNMIIAVKVVELEDDTTESYLTVFDLNGNVLLAETKFAEQKFEGIEFL